MRGNPKNQSGQIFRAIDKIGTSRHAAKTEAKQAGIVGSHQMAQHLGIFSFATMTKYRAITTEFLQWCVDKHGIKDSAKIQPAHVQEWLQVKIASGVRYKTFATYAAALGKMNVGLNAIYKRNENWSPIIDETRIQARIYLDKSIKSRGYLNPKAIIDNMDGIQQIVAKIQYIGGARIKALTILKKEQLLGNNTILLTNTKGGRRREIPLPQELYRQVEQIITRDGEFKFEYRTYLRHLEKAAFDSSQPYNGSHGLRWNFAQKTMKTIQENGLSYEEALRMVSERLGHSRMEITEHYLR